MNDKNYNLKNQLRFFDLAIGSFGLFLGLPIFIFVFLLVAVDIGSPLFFQTRLGLNKRPFVLIKFRTMPKDTASVATHLLGAPKITKIGQFLRKTKLDELPQLWNVVKGDMSLVGPRPGLPNQKALTKAREGLAVFDVRPGITGLSQLNGIDMTDPERLAKSDATMIASMSVNNYFLYIFSTLMGKGRGDRIFAQKH